MSAHHILLVAGGAVAAGAAAALGANGALHKAAVAVTEKAMQAGDAVAAETQSIVDEATDNRAEARRQAKIDAAVKEELAKLEGDIREKVTAKLDKAGEN